MPPSNRRPRAAPARALVLARFLPYRLSILSNRVSNAIAKAYSARFGLTIPQWRTLAVLGEAKRAPLTATEVTQATEMDKVTVSRAVAGLLERGLVRRSASPDDGRARMLELTREGRAIYDEVAPIALAYEARLLKALTGAERASLDALLKKLAAAAAELEPEAG